MNPGVFQSGRALAMAMVIVLACGTAVAEKPEWVGKGQGSKHEQKDSNAKQKGGKKTAEVKLGAYFADPQREAARAYYARQYSAKRCPPGLAKKNNGCMPPGQAKKWAVGQALPSDLVYYPVPQAVVVRLGVAPAGHRYVRVANDILLIAIGTRMVVDAIEDLMKF